MENYTRMTLNCSQFYTEQKFVNVAITSATAASLSFLACLFAIFIIILFKKWQSFGQRLIAYLIISATLLSVATILRRVDFDEEFTPADARFCTFSAFVVQITVWNLVDSIVAITVYLFLGAVLNKFTEKYELLYVLFIFVVPLIFSWIPFINDTFGRSGVWCWIKLVDLVSCERLVLGQVLQLALFYVPQLIILPSIIIVYLVMLCKFSRNRKRWKGIGDETYLQTNTILKSEAAHLLVYPLIFFALSLPVFVTRIQLWIDPQLSVIALWYISAISGNLEGAAITLAFLLLDKDTRRRLRWSHMRAAFKNYHDREGITEYLTEAEVEGEVGEAELKASYKQLTDDSYLAQFLYWGPHSQMRHDTGFPSHL